MYGHKALFVHEWTKVPSEHLWKKSTLIFLKKENPKKVMTLPF
jgi:hypothetical protein